MKRSLIINDSNNVQMTELNNDKMTTKSSNELGLEEPTINLNEFTSTNYVVQQFKLI